KIDATLIPATDTPGAKELGIHQFVMVMMDDCYDKNKQDGFVKGLDELNDLAKVNYKNSFVKCSSEERGELIAQMEKKDYRGKASSFFPLMKELTILGYMTSKYTMTKLRVYELVPGRFHGCVLVEKSRNII